MISNERTEGSSGFAAVGEGCLGRNGGTPGVALCLAPSRIAILRYIATDTWHGLHVRACYTANFGRPVNALEGALNYRIKSFRDDLNALLTTKCCAIRNGLK